MKIGNLQITKITGDELLAKDDKHIEPLEIPEWGIVVGIKALSSTELDEWEKTRTIGTGKDATMNLTNFRASFAVQVIVREDGKRMFGDSDIVALGRKSAKAVKRIFDRGRELAGVTEDEAKELESNLDQVQPADSSST